MLFVVPNVSGVSEQHTFRTQLLLSSLNGMTLCHISNSAAHCSVALTFCRLPYPMPPAGADLNTWVPDEEPQPIGISINLPPGSILPFTKPQAGFWDHKNSLWSTQDMGSVTVTNGYGAVAFQSKAIGCLAVVQRRTGLLPYKEWHVRPAGQQKGAEAMVVIDIGDLPP